MTYVISLGGSIIVPDEIDVVFLRRFIRRISSEIRRGHRLFIVTGGGATCRKYQSALKEISKSTSENLDWLGIETTKLNAHLMRLAFGNKVNISGGDKPGRSTDYEAVRMAKRHGAKTVINLSNIDYVYSADPKKNKSAKKFEQLTWTQYLKQFGRKWKPGANYPFDPVAAALAKKYKITAVIMNGRKLENLKNLFANKPFRGTIIK
ncbi:MAG: UMP kinase [Candidatus Doudnabacteria bacterium]|nr:UMP kinase [Candidatus Doudnabacteria bacterium]